MNKKILFSLVVLMLVVAACAPSDTIMEQPTEVMIQESEDSMMDEYSTDMTETADIMDNMSEEKATQESEGNDSMSEGSKIVPNWFEVSFTNVNSGETFKITDFSGKVVLVEKLAMWCSTCKKQQNEIVKLHEILGTNSDLVTVGLAVDPNEMATDLKKYTEANNFDWYYAIATQEVTAEISSFYGAQYLNPPSAPMLIIDRAGNVHTLPFGLKSATDLENYLDPFLSEGM